MTVNEFINVGLALADEFAEKAQKINFKDAAYDYALMDEADCREKVENVIHLTSNSLIKEKLAQSKLLENIPVIGESPAFDEIYPLFLDLVNSEKTGETHFAANRERYISLWDYPIRRAEQARRNAEEERIKAENDKIKFAKNLAISREMLSQLSRSAPCFTETRKNGLNCNHDNLIEIASFAPILANNKTLNITIKKCSKCWQLYKECFEVEETTKQFRYKFLKPNETSEEFGVHFSIIEANDCNEINFAEFVNPNLKNEVLPIQTNETAQTDSVVYENYGTGAIPLNSIIDDILLLLPDYNLKDNHFYRGSSLARQVVVKDEIYGDEKGAHLKYCLNRDTSNPYRADCGYESLKSHNLVHSQTGEKLEISIELNLNAFIADDIEIRFEGEKGIIEKLKNVTQQILNSK